jgi:hypothetical protein
MVNIKLFLSDRQLRKIILILVFRKLARRCPKYLYNGASSKEMEDRKKVSLLERQTREDY